LPLPVLLTATKIPFPKVTLDQLLFAAEFREVQITPSLLVMTLLPDPLLLTATKIPFPKVILRQEFPDAGIKERQFEPTSIAVWVEIVETTFEESDSLDVPAKFVATIEKE